MEIEKIRDELKFLMVIDVKKKAKDSFKSIMGDEKHKSTRIRV